MRNLYNAIYVIIMFVTVVVMWGFEEAVPIMWQWLLGSVLLIMTAIFTYINRRHRRE